MYKGPKNLARKEIEKKKWSVRPKNTNRNVEREKYKWKRKAVFTVNGADANRNSRNLF